MIYCSEWAKSLLLFIAPFADTGFQERVWLNGEGPEVSSYDEALCQLFDDTGLSDVLEDSSAEIINPEINVRIRTFDHLEKEIDRRLSFAEIKEMHRFEEMIRLAKELVLLLAKVI